MRAMLLAALAAATLPAQAAGERSQRRELKKVIHQLELKKRELESYRSLKEAVERDLSQLANEKELSERRLRELARLALKAQGRESEVTGKLKAISQAHERGRLLLSEELREYRRRVETDSGFYGRMDLWEDSLRRAAIRRKALYLAGLGVHQHRAALSHDRLRTQHERLEREALKARSELHSRRLHYQRKRQVYEDTEERLARMRREIRELEAAKLELSALLENLRSRRPEPRRAGKGLPVPRHSLPWPLAGRVVGTFGKKQVPELDTWVIHNGIDIAASAGEKVHPVGPGRVIFAGPFRSYGNVMVVEHDAGFHSVYGGLAEFLKASGERVNPAGPIATAGEINGEGRIYLELRQGSEALDPLLWLRRPSK